MQDGILILGDDSGSLYALGANGDIVWQSSTGDSAGKVVRIILIVLFNNVTLLSFDKNVDCLIRKGKG